MEKCLDWVAESESVSLRFSALSSPTLTLLVFSAEPIRSWPFVAASPAGVHVINALLTNANGNKDLF